MLHSLIILGCCGLFACPVIASESKASADTLPLTYLQLKAERQALISGEFDATVRISNKTIDEGKVINWILDRVHCSFDFATGRLLFKQRFVDASWDVKEMNTSAGPLKIGGVHDVSFIQTPFEMISHRVGTGIVDINPAGTTAPSMLRFFDVRRIGMMTLSGYRNGKSFESLTDVLEKYSIVEEGVDSSLSRLKMGNPQYPIALLVDTARGFTPLKMEAGIPSSDGKDTVVDLVSEVSWHEMSNVYVPQTAYIEWKYSTDECVREEYNFDWKRVNEPLSPEDFSVNALELPLGTVVWNRTQGIPFIERKIGMDHLPPARTPLPESGSGNRTRFLFLVANVIVVITLAALLIARHARKA